MMLLNADAPVSRLSADVLAIIFDIAALDSPTCANPPHARHTYDLGWIRLTHVSRRWREAALGRAGLWTTINLSQQSARCSAEMLKRSRDAPLVLSYIAPPPEPDHLLRPIVLQQVLRFHPRCRELHLQADYDVVEDTLDAVSHPSLSSLHLENTEQGADTPLLPAHLFSDAPALTSLSLHGFIIPWGAPVLSQLTRLELRVDPNSCLQLVTVAQLNALFQRMSNVHQIFLDNVYPMDMYPDPASSSSSLSLSDVLVHLPASLAHIHVGGYLPEKEIVEFASILVPAPQSSTRISIDIRRPIAPKPIVPYITHFFAHHVAATPTPPKALSFQMSAPNAYSPVKIRAGVRFSSSSRAGDGGGSEDAWREDDVQATWYLEPYQLASATTALYGIPLDEIVDLRLDVGSVADVVALLHRTTKAHRVHCTERTLGGIVGAFSAADDAETGGWLTLPLLESVCIVSDDRPSASARSADYEDLVTCLDARRIRGASLRELVLPKKRGKEPWFDAMCAVVPRVAYCSIYPSLFPPTHATGDRLGRDTRDRDGAFLGRHAMEKSAMQLRQANCGMCCL
ncbi:hypothetical protein OF83DRAFT_409395 [Amylostereum chailletii]|nr:hypothetical protein OF83DRAFT_409395 [Amylostereum chailletii]